MKHFFRLPRLLFYSTPHGIRMHLESENAALSLQPAAHAADTATAARSDKSHFGRKKPWKRVTFHPLTEIERTPPLVYIDAHTRGADR